MLKFCRFDQLKFWKSLNGVFVSFSFGMISYSSSSFDNAFFSS